MEVVSNKLMHMNLLFRHAMWFFISNFGHMKWIFANWKLGVWVAETISGWRYTTYACVCVCVLMSRCEWQRRIERFLDEIKRKFFDYFPGLAHAMQIWHYEKMFVWRENEFIYFLCLRSIPFVCAHEWYAALVALDLVSNQLVKFVRILFVLATSNHRPMHYKMTA